MHVEINGESVKFKPINIPYGRNSKYFIDSAKRYFLKVPHSNNQYNNELAALRILQKYDRYFPRLVFVGSNYLVTNYIDGKGISVSTRPANIIEQMKDIADMLEAEHIVHGDLHMSNIMIDIHEQVWLIDFGHSTIQNLWEYRETDLYK